MDYRRRYQRRLQNQSQANQKIESVNENKEDEKLTQDKNGEKSNVQNVYLQKLLVKNVAGQNNSLNLTSVNDNLPSSFTTNIRDILATEENKQRAIKYVIQKRNEEKYGTRGPITTDNNQEESNPVLSNKYYKYSRNINLKTDNDNKNIDINNNQGNQTNVDSKYSYSNYYTRRNRNYTNQSDNNNNLEKIMKI